MKTLVIGLPGSGKTTYCRGHLGDGLVYDLDAIAAAFRLREPHEERHEGSRRMANDILWGFVSQAGNYANDLYIIRTAPSVEDMEEIEPDRVVFCKTQHVQRKTNGLNELREKIADALDWCDEHGIPVTIL